MDVAALKNEIELSANEYQSKLKLASDIKQMYKCRDCTYSTNRPYNSRRHEKAMHKPSVTQMYKCCDCTYSTNCSSNLTIHEKAVHEPSVTFSSEIKKMYKCRGCRGCAYSTNWSSNLRKHENATHKSLVTEQIEYHSTIDVAALKNEIVQCDNEYKRN